MFILECPDKNIGEQACVKKKAFHRVRKRELTQEILEQKEIHRSWRLKRE